jgi:hypothetical protein
MRKSLGFGYAAQYFSDQYIEMGAFGKNIHTSAIAEPQGFDLMKTVQNLVSAEGVTQIQY